MILTEDQLIELAERSFYLSCEYDRLRLLFATSQQDEFSLEEQEKFDSICEIVERDTKRIFATGYVISYSDTMDFAKNHFDKKLDELKKRINRRCSRLILLIFLFYMGLYFIWNLII